MPAPGGVTLAGRLTALPSQNSSLALAIGEMTRRFLKRHCFSLLSTSLQSTGTGFLVIYTEGLPPRGP